MPSDIGLQSCPILSFRDRHLAKKADSAHSSVVPQSIFEIVIMNISQATERFVIIYGLALGLAYITYELLNYDRTLLLQQYMSRAILGTTAQAECDVTDLPR